MKAQIEGRANDKRKCERVVEFLSNSFNEDAEFCGLRVHLGRILREHPEFTGLFSSVKIFLLLKRHAAQAASKAPVLVIDWQVSAGCHLPSLTFLRFWHLNRLLIVIYNQNQVQF